MSYCRRGPDSDIYMYSTEDGAGQTWIVCHECALMEGEDKWHKTPKDALAHLLYHHWKGHKVPMKAIDRLEGETTP